MRRSQRNPIFGLRSSGREKHRVAFDDSDLYFGLTGFDWEPLRHVPGRSLRGLQFPAQLQAGNALQVACRHVERDGPRLIAELAGLHHRSFADAEPLAAVLAGVRHGWTRRAEPVIGRSAVRGNRSVLAADPLEPLLGYRVVRKLAQQLDDRDTLAIRLLPALRRMGNGLARNPPSPGR